MANHKNTYREWCLLAERDLSVAEHLAISMNPVPTEVIAFHCQQAVEKYLKGVLTVFGEDPPYIHDLDKLCLIAEKHLPLFTGISSLCTVINYFAVQPRYDFGVSLSDEDARMVLAHTKTIKNFLRKEAPELFENDKGA